MSRAATLKLVVLDEAEVRLAAKALKVLQSMPVPEEGDDRDDFALAAMNALNACSAALSGAHDDESCLVLCNVPALVKP